MLRSLCLLTVIAMTSGATCAEVSTKKKIVCESNAPHLRLTIDEIPQQDTSTDAARLELLVQDDSLFGVGTMTYHVTNLSCSYPLVPIGETANDVSTAETLECFKSLGQAMVFSYSIKLTADQTEAVLTERGILTEPKSIKMACTAK